MICWGWGWRHPPLSKTFNDFPHCPLGRESFSKPDSWTPKAGLLLPSPLSLLNFLLCVGVQLINNTVMASGGQWRDSAYMYMSPFSLKTPSHPCCYLILSSFTCCAIGPCWLSILNVHMSIPHSLTLSSPASSPFECLGCIHPYLLTQPPLSISRCISVTFLSSAWLPSMELLFIFLPTYISFLMSAYQSRKRY